MADLGIIFLRRKHTIRWYQSLFTIITGSMLFRYFWATLYIYKSTSKKGSLLFSGASFKLDFIHKTLLLTETC